MTKFRIACWTLALSMMSVASASTIVSVDAGWYRIGWDQVNAAAGARDATDDLLASSGSAYSFTALSAVTLSIADFQSSSERFEVVINSVSQGLSSPFTIGGSTTTDVAGVVAALSDSRFSRSIFNLAAGAYTVDVILRSGSNLPGSGALSVTSNVPEPGTIFLLSTGLLAVFLFRRRVR